MRDTGPDKSRQTRSLTLVAVAGETRTMRALTIALAATIAASGCTDYEHAPPAGVSQERRAVCTRDKEDSLDDCMPNVEWAVVPGLGWIYVAGGEYLCQSHCDRAEDDCWRQPSDPSATEAAG